MVTVTPKNWLERKINTFHLFMGFGVIVPRKIFPINQIQHPNLLDDSKRNKDKSIQSYGDKSIQSYGKFSEK